MGYSCQVINVTLKLSFATKSDFRDTWRGVDTSAAAITDCAYKILAYLCPCPVFFGGGEGGGKEHLGKHTPPPPKPGSAWSTFAIRVTSLSLESSCPSLCMALLSREHPFPHFHLLVCQQLKIPHTEPSFQNLLGSKNLSQTANTPFPGQCVSQVLEGK